MDEPYAIGSSTDGIYVWARGFRQPYTAEIALKVASQLVPLGERVGAQGCSKVPGTFTAAYLSCSNIS